VAFVSSEFTLHPLLQFTGHSANRKIVPNFLLQDVLTVGISLMCSRGLACPRGHLMEVLALALALDDKVLALALAPEVLALALALDAKALALASEGWEKGWHLRVAKKSLGLGLAEAQAKTFPPRPRLRDCYTCMLCSHSRCYTTVCQFLFRNASEDLHVN